MLGPLLLAACGHAATTYEVTDLDPDPGFFSQATAINDAGQVLISGSSQMFLWSSAGFQQLTSSEAGQLAVVHSLSAGGELAGVLDGAGVRGRPGAYVRLLPLIPRLGASGAVANAIGPNGVAVGTSMGEVAVGSSVLSVRRPVRWLGAQAEDLGTIGGREGIALAVNGRGQIAGWSTTRDESAAHATFWAGGPARDLHTLGVLRNSQANAINEAGIVVGQLKGFTATQTLPFVWTERDGMRELPSAGYSRGTALGLNNRDQIVGALDGSAILWENGKLVDLQTRLTPNAGWDLDAAYGVNDAGWIVGVGRGPSGASAVLLRPRGWDTNECSLVRLQIEVLQPLEFMAGDDLATEAARLGTGGRTAAAVAADGASRLLLRLTGSRSGTVRLSLRAADGAHGVTGQARWDGELSAPGGAERADALTVALEPVGGQLQGFAVYHAPEDFARPDTADGTDTMRILELGVVVEDAKCDPARRPLALAIVRPPLIVMHGLWSDRIEAFGRFEKELAKLVPGIQISGPDYANAAPLLANAHELRNHIVSVRERWLRRQIVATRADVFAHSMGGILSRMWAQASPAEYLRRDNHGRGDLHKLVTIDSPHFGGFPADILDVWEDECPEFTAALTEAMRLADARIDEGALKDLRSYATPILQLNTGRTTVPCHVIAGYFPAAKYTEEILNTLPLIKLLFEEIPVLRVFAGFVCDAPVQIPVPNDLVVSELSQLGGLKGEAIDTFEFPHMGAAGQPETVKRSLELLNLPSSDPAFAIGFPTHAPPLPASARLGGGGLARTADGRQRTAGSGPLTIVEPSPGALVQPGELVNVTVAAPPGAGLLALIVVAPQFIQVRTNGPFSIPLRIPSQAAGPLGIAVIGWDNLGRRLTNAVQVQVQPATILDALEVTPTEFHFAYPESSCRLGVQGRYRDGIARNLTLARTGTTYESSDPKVVTVSADGLMRPQGSGEATITIRHGVSARVPVSVTLLADADLRLSLESMPTNLWANVPARFTLRVTNLGPNAARTVALRQILAEGARYVAGTAGSVRWEQDQGQLRGYLEALATGQSVVVEFPLVFDSAGNRRLQWSVNSAEADSHPEDNVVETAVSVSQAPMLQAAAREGKVMLSWSNGLADYLLEASPVLEAGANWARLEGVALAGDRFELEVQAQGAARFFRLRRP